MDQSKILINGLGLLFLVGACASNEPMPTDLEVAVEVDRCARYFEDTQGDAGKALHVPAGVTCTITPRYYSVDSLVVEHGAAIEVLPGARNWLAFESYGDITIDGTVRFEQFTPSRNQFVVQTRRHGEFTHRFDPTSLGGQGGDGYVYRRSEVYNQCGNGGVAGAGAAGTSDYGGGGGAGPSTTRSGDPGVEFRPGAGPTRGGQGGRRSGTYYGGPLLLITEGEFSGSGEIFLRGSAGQDGEDPRMRMCRFNYSNSVGGGGGGGPGGEGGYLRVIAARCSDTIAVYTEGGRGGLGGGKDWHAPGIGGDGDAGSAGFIDQICGVRLN